MKKNVEVELKYAAGEVSIAHFTEAVKELALVTFDELVEPNITEKGLDTFYEVNGKVIRYRRLAGDSKGELTIKTRHSNKSTLVRTEVDVPVATDAATIDAFMEQLNAKELFTLRKDYVLFHIPGISERRKYVLDVVRYNAFEADLIGRPDVSPKHEPVTFIEIEVQKDSDISHEEAMEIVGIAGRKLAKKLSLGKPLNISLFEHFNS